MKTLKNIVVFQILTISGSNVFFVDNAKFFTPIFILTSYILYKLSNNRGGRWNTNVLLIIIIWYIVNTYIFHGNVKTNLCLSLSCSIIGTYFVVSSFDFHEFRTILLKELVWLSIISIIVQIGYDYWGLPSTSYSSTGKAMWLIFTVGHGYHRLSSIFWEPGLYQIVIIYTLCLFTDEFRFHSVETIIKRFLVLFIAMLMTKSTMGYLSTFIFLAGVLLSRPKRKGRLPILFFVLLPILIGMLFLLLQTEAVQSKIDQKDSEIASTSYYIRLNDNIGLLSMIMERPIDGFGIDTSDYIKANDSLDIQTASNGWLKEAAMNGVPCLLFFVYLVYKGVARMKNTVSVVLIMLCLLISQCNEYIIAFPYLLMYVFKFKSYMIENAKS